jgi:hypothetical protein
MYAMPTFEPPLYARDGFERLDARETKYRFDLDADIPWGRFDEPGAHVPAGWFEEAGLRADLLAGEEPRRIFDWAFGAATAELFLATEYRCLKFIERERELMAPSRSLQRFCDEEIKHCNLFRRYADLCYAREPALARMLKRLFPIHAARALEPAYLDPRLSSRPDARHYLFWASTLFLEELTVYFASRLGATAGVQPTWLACHQMHRREEVQHVATDHQYLLSLRRASEHESAGLSEIIATGIVQGLACFNAVPCQVVAECFPDAGSPACSRPITRTALFSAVIHSPDFRRTRAHVPLLVELAGHYE